MVLSLELSVVMSYFIHPPQDLLGPVSDSHLSTCFAWKSTAPNERHYCRSGCHVPGRLDTFAYKRLCERKWKWER
jgi:hypothetical protein